MRISKARTAEGQISLMTLKQTAWLRQRCMCLYCGSILSYAEVTADHFVPLLRGGRTSEANIVASCQPCNVRKGSDHPDDFADRTRLFQRLPELREFWPAHGSEFPRSQPSPEGRP